MSTETMSSPAQAANVKPASTHDLPGEEPALQDLLAERTLAMIGGAPKPEVDRLATAEQAHLARTPAETGTGVEHPASHEAGAGPGPSPERSPTVAGSLGANQEQAHEEVASGAESTPETTEQAKAAPSRESGTPESDATPEQADIPASENANNGQHRAPLQKSTFLLAFPAPSPNAGGQMNGTSNHRGDEE